MVRGPPRSTLFPTRRSSDLGIEAEAAMLGQPMYMVAPEVVGFRLHGRLREGVTATDLVLTVTQMLRRKGVRSEEHTSELQSRENLVCRLLLEKKKKEKQLTD